MWLILVLVIWLILLLVTWLILLLVTWLILLLVTWLILLLVTWLHGVDATAVGFCSLQHPGVKESSILRSL